MADPKNDEFRKLAANVATTVLAELLGLTQPATSKLYQERVITQNGRRGKYDLFETIPKYIQSIRTSGTAEAGAKLKIAQREKLEIQNRRERGELIKMDDAAEIFRAACIAWRAGASAIPRRLATELSNEKSAAVCRDRLAHEIDELYAEFEKGLVEYFGASFDSTPSVKPRAKSAKTSAKKKPRRVGGRKPNTTPRKRGTRKVAK